MVNYTLLLDIVIPHYIKLSYRVTAEVVKHNYNIVFICIDDGTSLHSFLLLTCKQRNLYII
jgi:hypothetical protein